eukprot:12386542-Alexandrium_andersonii.AAC.1
MLRNAGHAGQSSFLASVDDPCIERLCRATLSSWEHMLAANIMHASKLWYATQLERLRQRHCAALAQDSSA